MQRWIQRDVGLAQNPKTWRLGQGHDAMARVLLFEELLALCIIKQRGGLLTETDLQPVALASRLEVFGIRAEDIRPHLDALTQARFLEAQDGGCLRIRGWDDVYPSWTDKRKQKPAHGSRKATCEHCGQTFGISPRAKSHRYCSSRCRVRAHRGSTAFHCVSNETQSPGNVKRSETKRSNAVETQSISPQTIESNGAETQLKRTVKRRNAGEENSQSTTPPTPPSAFQPFTPDPEGGGGEENQPQRPDSDPIATTLCAHGVRPSMARHLARDLNGAISIGDIAKLAQRARQNARDPAGMLVSWLRSGDWSVALAGKDVLEDDELQNGAGRIWGITPEEQADWNRRFRAPEND